MYTIFYHIMLYTYSFFETSILEGDATGCLRQEAVHIARHDGRSGRNMKLMYDI